MIVAIERGFAHSFLVVTEPRSALRKRFTARGEARAFGLATGYASTVAAIHGLELADRTGRLSDCECRDLVAAQLLDPQLAAQRLQTIG